MNSRRRGYALIEVLVVITIVSVMLALCAGMIHLLLKLDRVGRSASDVSADLSRLARDFRADAHAAAPEDPKGRSGDRLTLSIAGDRTVEYQFRPADILRTVREGTKVRHFETYRKPARSTVRIDVTRDGPRPLATLIVARALDGQDDSLYSDYRIDAELGKDRRLTPRSE
jgi:prepilin-type N-terminal cleavage/methylation domain-containing protein